MYEGEWPEEGNPLVAQRGLYTITATYTLKQVADEAGNLSWVVDQAAFESPPDWKE